MSKHDEKIDAAILAAAGAEWLKVAVMISKVFEDPELKDLDDLAAQVAERIYTLVDNGNLASQGNMRRWRDGEVRAV